MKITIRCTDLNVTPSDASGFILTCEVADAAELANHFDDEIDKARRLGRAFRESILDATEEELREAMGDEEFEKQAAAGHAVVQRALASVAAPQEEQGGAPEPNIRETIKKNADAYEAMSPAEKAASRLRPLAQNPTPSAPVGLTEGEIARFVDDLFQEADRLVLWDDTTNSSLGGWCRSAIQDRVRALVSRHRSAPERGGETDE